MTFKVAIFDLDMTLWDGEKLYDDTVKILQHMKNNNVHMYIASFHSAAPLVIKDLGIINYFKEIHYGMFCSKACMIERILQKHPNVKKNEVIFFDDNLPNIKDVSKKHGIHTVLIINGIKWDNVPISFLQKKFNLFFRNMK